MESAIPLSTTRFEAEIARYNKWREDLTGSVNAYHDWLESNGQLDVQQSIRFYDLLENLNKGRLMLAFLAEFSRGKSELINALFFSSFKERLLPSDVGRTTMCPTEIFHDPTEEPYLKLLSVETRYRDESITQLKNMPVEWSKVRLNTNSAAEMKKALSALADVKQVYALEARMLGLSPMLNERGELPGEEELVDVPAWRYAMINYPHPLLTNGLSILDTPGLNALGMEPELTVSTIPNAHAVLFLLSIDTGVTKSDLEIWDRYVRPGLPQKIAVLNKIDLMWDELKTPIEVDRAIMRMMDTTGQALNLPRERIFAISAQKALLGKIREDAGLVKKSGIEPLERFLADEIVPMKRQILCKAVVGEIGGMMSASRASVATKQDANIASIAELNGLVGKSRDVVMKLWARITAEKNAYNAALAEYKVNHSHFSAKRTALMDMLNPAKLDVMLEKSATALDDSWTTMGLQRGMRELAKLMGHDFEAAFKASEDIKRLMQGVYNTFIEKFGFQKMVIPPLDLELHLTKLKLMVAETDAFSRDPLNVANYKSFFVKKFYNSLVAQARSTFMDAKLQTERWVQAVQLPLETQIKDHKAQLQSRLDSLAKINEKSSSINEQMAALKAAEADLRKQREMIEGLIQRVSIQESRPPIPDVVMPSQSAAEQVIPPDMLKTTVMSTFDSRKLKTAAAAAAARKAAEQAPMISDDMLAQVAPAKAEAPAPASPVAEPAPQAAAPADNAQDTQKLDPDRTQQLEAQKKQKSSPDGDRTVQIAPLDPDWRPRSEQEPDAETTQELTFSTTTKLNPGDTQKLEPTEKLASNTQRLDDSIQRLQEAKRLLQNVPK